MANWAYIENNNVKELYDNLPSSWKNISGLDKSSKDLTFLKSIGWYPVIKNEVEYDNSTHTVEKYVYDIEQNSVKRTPVIIQRPQQEVIELTVAQKDFEYLSQLRQQRNELLKSTDWTQLADVQKTHSVEWVQNWDEYRQTLRDLPNTYISNTFLVQWPTQP